MITSSRPFFCQILWKLEIWLIWQNFLCPQDKIPGSSRKRHDASVDWIQDFADDVGRGWGGGGVSGANCQSEDANILLLPASEGWWKVMFSLCSPFWGGVTPSSWLGGTPSQVWMKGTPSSWWGGVPPGKGYPPAGVTPLLEQHSMHLLRGGRCASCVHAGGGLSCLANFIPEKRIKIQEISSRVRSPMVPQVPILLSKSLFQHSASFLSQTIPFLHHNIMTKYRM